MPYKLTNAGDDSGYGTGRGNGWGTASTHSNLPIDGKWRSFFIDAFTGNGGGYGIGDGDGFGCDCGRGNLDGEWKDYCFATQ